MTSIPIFSPDIGDFNLNPALIATILGISSRSLRLTQARSDAGVSLTATAAAGAVGISRTAGTSFFLVSEATSASAVTDKALWELYLSDTYTSGANITVTVNCNTAGAGTITAGSTTMTVAAYTEVNGVEAALVVSAAQQIPAAAGNLVFTITGTGLVAAQRITIELVMLVTSASGANTGRINSVSYAG